MRDFFATLMRKMPVYLAALGVMLATVASGWYAILAVQEEAPMTPWMYLGWLALHVVTTALLAWAMWLQREWFGLRPKAAVIAYGIIAGWWCLPAPLYFLLTVNLDTLQLRWANVGWLGGLALVGFVLLGGAAVALVRPIRTYAERGKQPVDPMALYRYTLRYPRTMAQALLASTVLAFAFGSWQLGRFSFLPLIEQMKVVGVGLVTALLASLCCYFCYDMMLSAARRRLEEEYALINMPRRSFARRILLATLLVALGSVCLIGLAVVQSTQALIHHTVQAELARDIAAVQGAFEQTETDSTPLRPHFLAMLKQGPRSLVFEGVEKFTASELDAAPEVDRRVAQQDSGIVQDARREHKVVGWFIDPISGNKIISVVFLSDFYGPLGQVLGFYGVIALMVLVIAVLMATAASQQLAAAMRRLAEVVRQAQAAEQPFIYDTYTADELEELAHAFAYYSLTVQQRTDELREAVIRLQELDRVKGDFISTASHQLRTPLTGLKWSYDALLNGDLGPLQQPQQAVVEQGLAKTVFMINLINSLLDVARLEDYNVKLAISAVDLPELLRKLIIDLEPLAQEKNIKIELKLPDYSVPVLQADLERLLIVFTNLIDNAIKYTPKDGSITVRIDGDSREVRVAVSDTGIGIPADIQHRLFTKFFRAPNAATAHASGSGLGLYITKDIITRHAGRIDVKSDTSRGSTFTVYLPVKQPVAKT